jgi:hypothetical protein
VSYPLWDAWNRRLNGALAQAKAYGLPPGLQPTRDGVGRAGAQVGSDSLDGGTFAGGDDVVRCLVHIQFADALGHWVSFCGTVRIGRPCLIRHIYQM